MKNLLFRVITIFLFTISTVFAQQEAKTSLTPTPARDFCFNVVKAGEGGCPVGEDIPYDTPLLEAIHQRDIELIKHLISDGADVNQFDSRGFSPLILAAGGDFELITILLKAGADVNAESKYGATPLNRSARCSRAVKIFLEAGANVNHLNINKRTALMFAAESGNIESIELLLNANADISAKDVEGMTALLYAIKGGNVDITKFIYDKGGQKDLSNEKTAALALTIAAGNSQTEMVKFLLQTGINPNARGKYETTAITTAAMRNNAEVLRLLIEAGADVNIKGPHTQAAIGWAAQYGYTEIVKLLIAAKADVNVKQSWSPLINAARNNQVETMDVLLKAGARINEHGEGGKTALMDAATGLKVEAVKFLIENGADVNARDKYNNDTALSLIKKFTLPNNDKQSEIIRMLINAGAIE